MYAGSPGGSKWVVLFRDYVLLLLLLLSCGMCIENIIRFFVWKYQ